MIKYEAQRVIEVGDWDTLVKSTYGKPYSFQQQDDCKPRGLHHLTIDPNYPPEEFYGDTIEEVINGNDQGVSFKAWLARDPKEWNGKEELKPWTLKLFWHRSFYPDIDMVAWDLYKRGLLEAGDYTINIDW